MTLISATTNNGFPVLMGDLLLSGSETDGNIETPSFLGGTGDLFKNETGLKPYKLTRKLYVVNEQMCVGLGGNYGQMYSLLNSLISFFSEKVPTVKELVEYFEWYDKDKLNGLFGILFLAEKIGTQTAFNPVTIGNWKTESHPVFENIFVSGSGTLDFLDSIKTFDRIYWEGKTDGENKALSQNILLLSIFLGHEILSAKSLINKWGAGFEIIIYKDNQFQLIDDFTFLFWNGSISKNSGLKSLPFRIMKYKYEGDLLIIRACDFDKKESAFGVIPLNKQKENYELDKVKIPEYQSSIINSFYLLKLDNGAYITPTMSLYSEEPGEIIIRFNEGYLEVLTSTKLSDHIERTLMELAEIQ